MRGDTTCLILRKRRVSIFLLSALFSLSFPNTGQTALAFTHTKIHRQQRAPSPSSVPLHVTASIEIRTEPEKSPISKRIQHRRFGKRRRDGDPNIEFLKDLGLPLGLRNALLDNIEDVVHKHIWIIDNSGSMKLFDGHKISELIDDGTKDKTSNKVIVRRTSMYNGEADGDYTRWTEEKETLKCLVDLMTVLDVPVDGSLLNKPERGGLSTFSLSRNGNNWVRNRRQNHRAKKMINGNRPAGDTQLYKKLAIAKMEVISMQEQLLADGKKITIVIFSDGSDHRMDKFEDELESLKGLPVNVVIRLCTDHGEHIGMYNDFDEKMDYVDVLDDWEAEAHEVYEQNPWLNYALVLHRMREIGLQGSNQLLDDIDERPLKANEIRDFIALLFGTSVNLLPDPLCDWQNFVTEIYRLQQREKLHRNPLTTKHAPWIDTKELKKHLRLNSKNNLIAMQ